MVIIGVVFVFVCVVNVYVVEVSTSTAATAVYAFDCVIKVIGVFAVMCLCNMRGMVMVIFMSVFIVCEIMVMVMGLYLCKMDF